ncbi:MAG: chaperone modulator CbpM [Chitinophagaceae bacterium]|nr:chaperone modulator CbpM [Chitinophagaceae bacterium]MCW5929645.1 chaperone modulator CbpM [Chitinophagaceae bacterium]
MPVNKELIAKEEYCSINNIEVAFIDRLYEYGLLEIRSVEQRHFIHLDQLQTLERFTRLHYDLDINMEGIDAIANLLERVKTMQQEIQELKSRLHIYSIE